MSRIVLISSLFFGLSFAAVFGFCRNAETDSVRTEDKFGGNETKNLSQEILVNKEAGVKSDFTCQDDELSKIWQEIWKEEFVRDFFAEQKADGDCSEYLKIAKRIDLNGDGANELFVEGKGTISAASTMPIWVMQKQGDGYKSLLREQGEFYDVKQAKTNGYRNLFFPSRRSVASAFLSTYAFENGKYQIVKCQIEFYNEPRKIRKVFECDDKKEIEKFENSLSEN